MLSIESGIAPSVLLQEEESVLNAMIRYLEHRTKKQTQG
jgi:hypothetical protein